MNFVYELRNQRQNIKICYSTYVFLPATRTCCNGGQAFGKSHCWPDSTRDVGTTPLQKTVPVFFRYLHAESATMARSHGS